MIVDLKPREKYICRENPACKKCEYCENTIEVANLDDDTIRKIKGRGNEICVNFVKIYQN